MTKAAREVLDDCRIALEILQDEEEAGRWRVHWAGAVALIRAVGHVLLNVDQARDVRLAVLGNAAHREWKRQRSPHEIYRRFIEDERNNILKEYKSSVYPLTDVPVLTRIKLVNQKTGEVKYVDEIHNLDKNLFRPIVEGYGEGEDARDVYEEAINWWEQELHKIEQASSI